MIYYNRKDNKEYININMRTRKESLLTESTIESIEEVAKLLKPYVKQWCKSTPVNNEYSDDLVPVKNMADGIIK